MPDIAQKHSDRLHELKDSVRQAQQYFDKNYKLYKEFMRFVFDTAIGRDEESALQEIGKPALEFNIIEAYVSKLRGEFAKQQPSLTVRAADGVPLSSLTPQFNETLKVIEAHLRAIFFDGTNDKLEYQIYSDLLAGGFSVVRVFTEYLNEMSFDQRICAERVFDPCLTIFDPLARTSHKGDGRFSGELYPMTRESFESEFGEEATKLMKFTRELGGFNWSFKAEKEDIVVVCDYYEKVLKKAKIVKLSNGHVVTDKQYKAFMEQWEKEGHIEQPPIPVGKPRTTTLEHIVRYRFCESMILDVVETDYKYLPLVFIDGNSVMLDESGNTWQKTRPYVYNTKGIQRLRNYAGQSLAQELENTIQHKFIVALEAIPVEYQTAYQNVQKADVLVYNNFLDTNNPNVVLPPPREVVRTPIPPEISATFQMSDQITQSVLGHVNENQVEQAPMSGIAFARSALTSNTAAMPYLVGYIKGLNRVAQIIVDLIPKYYLTPRSLPILENNGKRSYQMINKAGSIYMNYDPNNLQVNVETGVNFAIQKEMALTTIIQLMQASPLFAQFMNQEGLPILLDNIDIRGIEDLKMRAETFQKKMGQQQQQMAQAQMQQSQIEAQKAQMEMAQAQKALQAPTAEQLGLMSLQQKAQTDKEKAAIDAGKLAVTEREAEIKFLDVMAKIKGGEIDNELGAAKLEAEHERGQVELAIEISKHHHEINQPEEKKK